MEHHIALSVSHIGVNEAVVVAFHLPKFTVFVFQNGVQTNCEVLARQ